MMENNFAEFTLELNHNNLNRNTKFYFSEEATDNLDQGLDAAVFGLAHKMIFQTMKMIMALIYLFNRYLLTKCGIK